MKITVHYFAILRDQRGTDHEILETNAATPKELYEEIANLHGLGLTPKSLKVAINDDFAAWDTALNDGDSVAIIPPVAGG